jgi:hypothetical protein
VATGGPGVLEKGTTLAGYRIDGVLGQGGMGVVYEATQLSLDRVVALKVLASHLGDDPSFLTRFQREGRIQAGIDHPHIVTVYDSGSSEHGFFIAMRLVRGPNLKDLIVARELDAGRTLRIVTPVAEALDAAHTAGLIHRDIKPQNILVGGRDQAYLADFGLTKASGESGGLTKTGQFVGTLDYISPEQIRGEPATKASDVYALAGVLYECLSGVVPYPKESEAAVLYAHMADPPPRLSEVRPDLPASVEGVLVRAMAKDPAERHPSAGELMHEANRAFSRRTRAAFTPPGPIEAPQETGIRAAEADVGTREGQRPEPPDETRVAPGPAETVPAAEGVPDVTRAGAPPPETTPAEAPGETQVAGPGETQVAGPGETQVAGPGETQVAGPGETQVAGPGETRVAEPGETQVAGPGPTRVGGPQQRAAAAPGAGPGGVAATAVGGATPGAGTPTVARPAPAVPPIALVAVGAVLALIVGFLIGRSGSGSDTPSGTKTVSAGPLDLAAPTDWTRSASPAQVPGLDLGRDAVTVSPSGGADQGTLTMGVTDATGATLLPTSFTSRLASPPEPTDGVRLGNLEAYRYRGLKPRGFSDSLTVYAAPTTEGVATVACAAPSGKAGAFLPECERVAAALELKGAKPYELGVDDDYESDLTDQLDGLNAARSSGVRKLKSAKTAAGQARAANSIAAAYGSVASSLTDADVSPEFAKANDSLVGALRQSGSAYRRLAASARRDSSSGYNAARRAVSRAEAAVQRALGRLKGD